MAVPRIKVPGSSLNPDPVGSSLRPGPGGSSLRPVAGNELTKRPLGSPMKPRSPDPEGRVGRFRPGAPGDPTFHPISTMPSPRPRPTNPPGNLEKFPRVIPDRPGQKPPVFRTTPAPKPLPQVNPAVAARKKAEMEHQQRIKANIRRHQPLQGHALEEKQRFQKEGKTPEQYAQYRQGQQQKAHSAAVKANPKKFDKNGRPKKPEVSTQPIDQFNKGAGKANKAHKMTPVNNKAAAIQRLLKKAKSGGK